MYQTANVFVSNEPVSYFIVPFAGFRLNHCEPANQYHCRMVDFKERSARLISYVAINARCVSKNESNAAQKSSPHRYGLYINITGLADFRLVGVPKDKYHRVSTQKHLANISVLVDRPGFLLSLARLGRLRPHFLHVLEHHIAVSVEGLHAGQQLVVVSAVNKNL